MACGGADEDSVSIKVEEESNEQIHVAHILIMYQGATRAPLTVNRTKDEARAQAEALLEKINRGAAFSQLARLYSDCPSSRRGGDLDMIRRGDLAKPFEEAAFNLKSGEVSGIVETEFGFHIIKNLQDS
jgi:hypothetical protein